MWYRWVLNVVLAVVLTVIVCITGFFTYNQINKEFISFETIADGIEATNFCKKFANGDIDSFIDGLDISYFSNMDIDSINAFMEDQRRDLTKVYNEQLKNKKLKVFLEDASYSKVSGVEKGKCFTIIDAIVGIQIEKDYTLYLNLEKSSCEKFKLTGVWYAPELDENGKFITNQYEELNNILNEFHYYDNIDANYRTYKAMMQKLFENMEEVLEEDRPIYYFLKNANLSEETEENMSYKKNIKNRIKTLMDKQVMIEDCILKDIRYDTKKKVFITEMLWIVKNYESGKSVVVVRELEIGENGFCKTEKETEVIGEGMREEVKEQLEKVFE